MMNELRLTLPGTIRSKKNSKRIFARGNYKTILPSKAYEAWEKQARAAAWKSGAIIPPLACNVQVTAICFYKGQRPDLSGCLESVGDCLEGVVWANDGLIESWDGSRVIHDLKNPRTEVTVRWD